ncbi:hypothetical protein ABH935_005438 [Catenulispora sp. GAS73]|uniref:hypothetical protein n=1 Tax=Catenulispora sp. GAS73 TaxID=3156269 RepID=UPI003515DBA2
MTDDFDAYDFWSAGHAAGRCRMYSPRPLSEASDIAPTPTSPRTKHAPPMKTSIST